MAEPSPDEPKKPAEKPAPKAPRKAALPVITANRMFVLLILIVTGAFVFSLIGLALLAILAHEPPTEMQKRFGEVCVYIAMVTIGALVGLLGGKAASAERVEIGDK